MEKKILIVDDEKPVLKLLTRVFLAIGDEYLVKAVENAEASLNCLEKENYHLFFLDLNLPDMNGVELCKVIRKKYPISIIYGMTGYSSLFDLAECRAAGFDDYFVKPISNVDLIRSVDEGFSRLARWVQ